MLSFLYYFQIPQTIENGLEIATDVDRRWRSYRWTTCINFASSVNCNIFCNYKGSYSIVLVSAVDSSYKFFYVVVKNIGDFLVAESVMPAA